GQRAERRRQRQRGMTCDRVAGEIAEPAPDAGAPPAGQIREYVPPEQLAGQRRVARDGSVVDRAVRVAALRTPAARAQAERVLEPGIDSLEPVDERLSDERVPPVAA